MKKCVKIFMFLFIFIGLILFIIPTNENIYAEEGLYFDDDCNLVFATYNKKATSKIRYLTAGWAIKKYDEPLNTKGQIYGIISKPEYYYTLVDDSNPGYIYTYFYMKKEDVMKAIEKASPQWKAYLEKYGGTIYMDSVMTVKEYDLVKGGLYMDGTGWGEIYYDFNGISGARWWAKPEYLREYFDIPVMFPAQLQEPDVKYETPSQERIYVSKDIITSTMLGSHSISSPEFDVSLGIPSGEDLYACGFASECYYEGVFIKNTGIVKVPVKVITDYELSWTDTAGRARLENQRVERWYMVDWPYSYYSLLSFEAYSLCGAEVTGTATGNITENFAARAYATESFKYGAVANHIKAEPASCYGGRVVVNSINNLKPDIPDENQKAIADREPVNCQVRNDRLIFEKSKILNDQWGAGLHIGSVENNNKTFYKTGIIIPAQTGNGTIANEKAVYTYKNGDKQKLVNGSVNNITVHTPVVCGGSLSAPRKYNMSVKPKANQIVLGTDFSVRAVSCGTHRDIRGYGYGDYGRYVKKYLVRFPFEVKVEGKTYGANQWIIMTEDTLRCYIPQNVPVGTYVIEFMAVAENYNFTDINLQKAEGIKAGNQANLLTDQYGARSAVEVEVIGTIYGFSIYEEADRAYVGTRLGFYGRVPEGARAMPILAGEVNDYSLYIYSNGFGSEENDKITGKLTGYCIDEGERQEVDLYIAKTRDVIRSTNLVPIENQVVWTGDNKTKINNNIYEWETKLSLGGSVIALPKGTVPASIEVIERYAIRNKNILINFEVLGYCGEIIRNSYINVENYGKGYCNMWKTEGFNYKFVDKAVEDVTLTDGDAIILKLPEKIYDDYEIIGTH